MNISKVLKIGDMLEELAEATDTTIFDVVDALVGICFSESDGEEIKQYNRDIRFDE